MRKKFHSFLMEKALIRIDETIQAMNRIKSENMNESERKKVAVMFLKALVFLAPIIIERLLIASPKLIFKWMFSTDKNIYSPYGSFWLSVAKFLYSPQNFENVFKPVVSDWREEIFEALNENNMWRVRWINVRYTYAFLVAMWQKSPIGDLIEFISKLAK